MANELRKNLEEISNDYQSCLLLANSIKTIEYYKDTTATAEDIREGKVAYSNGERIVGIMPVNNSNATVITSLPAGNSYGSKIAANCLTELVGNFIAGKDASFMFYNCSKLQKISALDTSNTINMSYLFSGCSSLLEAPILNTDNVTNIMRMFYNCSNLQRTSSYNTSKVTNANTMFYGCASLTEAVYLDTSLVDNASGMFFGCTNLVSVPVYDLSNCTELSGIFQNCPNLSDESLNNILQTCISAVKASSTTGENNLRNIGLSTDQIAKCKTLSNYQAFLDAGWSA